MNRTGIRRRAFSRVANSARQMRQQAARNATLRAIRGPTNRMARRALRSAAQEKKGVDTDLTNATIVATTNTNDDIFVTNLIQMGSGSWNRIGKRAILKSLRVKGFVQFLQYTTVATGVAYPPTFRLIVVWDKQPSGNAIPAFDQIFGITAQDGTESCPSITCPPRYDNMDRFKVLKDCMYVPPPMSVSSTGTAPVTQVYVPVDEYIKLPLLECVFSGQSQPMTIADISTGALYVIMRQTNAAGNLSQTGFQGNARLRYTD